MKNIRIGIISFAHMHANSYAAAVKALAGAELVAIADEDRLRGEDAAKRFGASYYADYRQMLALDIDAVIVTSENVRHLQMVEDAARAKKQVLCEKPIATTVADAKRMIATCREQGVILQTAFPVRFSPPVRRAREVVQAGQIGKVVAIRGTNHGRNPGGWFADRALSGGGAVLDHTVHVIDLMRWFTGSEVKSVYAEVDTCFTSGDIDDVGLLTLEFENGIIASHDPSWSRTSSFPTWGDVTMEIVGTGGVTRLDALAQHMTLHSEAKHHTSYEPWGDSFDDGLIADFVDCVREKRAPSISGEDGLRALEVALAAYESARTGRPVTL